MLANNPHPANDPVGSVLDKLSSLLLPDYESSK